MNFRIIINIVYLFFMLCLLYLYIRNNNVYKFRISIARKSVSEYSRLPKRTKMLFSFKKLKLKDKKLCECPAHCNGCEFLDNSGKDDICLYGEI